MRQRIKLLLTHGFHCAEQHKLKIRFLLTGALNTIVGLGMYPGLYFLLSPFHFHYLVLLTISHILCVTFAFFTTKFFVFRTVGNYLSEFSKFGSYHLMVYIINLIILPLLVNYLFMHPALAQFLFALFVVVTSYFWHSRISFRAKFINN